MRRLTSFLLAILIALSVPVWPPAANPHSAPVTAAGGFSNSHSSDATMAAPKATVVSQSGWQARPGQVLLGPRFSSLEPDSRRAARLADARLRSFSSLPYRSYPLLI